MKREARNISKEEFKTTASESFQRINAASENAADTPGDNTSVKASKAQKKKASKNKSSKKAPGNKSSLKNRFSKLLSSDSDRDEIENDYTDNYELYNDTDISAAVNTDAEDYDYDTASDQLSDDALLVKSVSKRETGDAQLIRNVENAADDAAGITDEYPNDFETAALENSIQQAKKQPQRVMSARELILAAVRESENGSTSLQGAESPVNYDEQNGADDLLDSIIVDTPSVMPAKEPVSDRKPASDRRPASNRKPVSDRKPASDRRPAPKKTQPRRELSKANVNRSVDKNKTQRKASSSAAVSVHPEKKLRRMTPEQKRQRADMQASAKAVLMFFVFMILMVLFLLVIPRSTKSELERRTLSTMPSFSLGNYFSGEFTSGITQYYDDTIPARDSITNASNTIKSLFGFTTSGTAEIIGNVAKVNTNTDTTPETTVSEDIETETSTEAETTTAAVKNTKDYRGEVADASYENGILIVYQDGHYRALVLYGGVYEYVYADTANYMHAMLGDSVNVYFMPLPVASQFYLPSNYSDYSADQKEGFDDLYSHMNSEIKYVEVVDVLNDHNKENIYFRTDHHWCPLGAYYAAQEFAKAADVPFTDISEYEEHVAQGYVGTMYAYTSSASILNDPEDFVWYSAPNNYSVDYYDRAFNYQYTYSLFFDTPLSNYYSTFLGTDDEIAKITTDVKNGRNLLIVKDSYGNAMVPFLVTSFEHIYVVDQRYFECNLLYFIQTCGVTDLLLANNAFCIEGAEAELLDDIVYNYGGVYIYDAAPDADLEEEMPMPSDEVVNDISYNPDDYDYSDNSEDYSDAENADYSYEDYGYDDSGYDDYSYDENGYTDYSYDDYSYDDYTYDEENYY